MSFTILSKFFIFNNDFFYNTLYFQKTIYVLQEMMSFDTKRLMKRKKNTNLKCVLIVEITRFNKK